FAPRRIRIRGRPIVEQQKDRRGSRRMVGEEERQLEGVIAPLMKTVNGNAPQRGFPGKRGPILLQQFGAQTVRRTRPPAVHVGAEAFEQLLPLRFPLADRGDRLTVATPQRVRQGVFGDCCFVVIDLRAVRGTAGDEFRIGLPALLGGGGDGGEQEEREGEEGTISHGSVGAEGGVKKLRCPRPAPPAARPHRTASPDLQCQSLAIRRTRRSPPTNASRTPVQGRWGNPSRRGWNRAPSA